MLRATGTYTVVTINSHDILFMLHIATSCMKSISVLKRTCLVVIIF